MRALRVLGVLAAIILCLAVATAVVGVIALYWYGVLKSLMIWQSVPMAIMVFISFLLIGMCLVSRAFAFIIAIFGFFGTVLVLNWAWYLSLLLYLPVLFIGASVSVFAVLVMFWFVSMNAISKLARKASR